MIVEIHSDQNTIKSANYWHIGLRQIRINMIVLNLALKSIKRLHNAWLNCRKLVILCGFLHKK